MCIPSVSCMINLSSDLISPLFADVAVIFSKQVLNFRTPAFANAVCQGPNVGSYGIALKACEQGREPHSDTWFAMLCLVVSKDFGKNGAELVTPG